jgi:Tfp pilus assembly protein PilV
MNISAILQALENALTTAAGTPGLIGVIFVALVGLAIGVLIIANYFYAANIREQAAYNAQLATQQTQAANLAQMQADASQALISNMDTTWQQDYNYFVQMLEATPPNTVAIYAKLNIQFQTQIAGFIYNTSLPATQRAAQIIMLMQQASGNGNTGGGGTVVPASS